MKFAIFVTSIQAAARNKKKKKEEGREGRAGESGTRRTDALVLEGEWELARARARGGIHLAGTFRPLIT